MVKHWLTSTFDLRSDNGKQVPNQLLARGGPMKKYICASLALVTVLFAPSCEPGPGHGPDGGAGNGVGGMGGAPTSDAGALGGQGAASSSSGLTETCDINYVESVCEGCKAMGCPPAMDDDEPCHRIGVIHYTDMIGCIQLVPGACPACPNPAAPGDTISADCSTCIAAFGNCNMDCYKAVRGIP